MNVTIRSDSVDNESTAVPQGLSKSKTAFSALLWVGKSEHLLHTRDIKGNLNVTKGSNEHSVR